MLAFTRDISRRSSSGQWNEADPSHALSSETPWIGSGDSCQVQRFQCPPRFTGNAANLERPVHEETCLVSIFPIFEWVRNANGKKRLVAFAPDGCDRMWAPALYDSWVSKDNQMSFHSFAVITGDPRLRKSRNKDTTDVPFFCRKP